MLKEYPKLLIADKRGKIFDVPYLQATGMKGGEYFLLEPSDLIKLHSDSELFMLPCRQPVGFDRDNGDLTVLGSDPYSDKKESCYAVSAFLSPGYTTTFSASYKEKGKPSLLPLFSYSAVALYKGEFYATGIRVDRQRRQELCGMSIHDLRDGIREFNKLFPKNRLIKHLNTCALTYGCPAAKNFFLKRYEGPLPTSPTCNSRCIGCISHQPPGGCSVTQPRITFVPSPEEIAETALLHLKNVKDPVVSFGQGCEGEPLMAGDVLVKAVEIIRKTTSKGIINLNTNASRPEYIKKLFNKGLDSIRVSINSVRKPFYDLYYKPKGYTFNDVIKSINIAKRAEGFVSINYLSMPGFTDSISEVNALYKFIEKTNINMIQWRNLNYDPAVYFKKLKFKEPPQNMIGIDILIKSISAQYPHIMKGYFNPSYQRIKRHLSG